MDERGGFEVEVDAVQGVHLVDEVLHCAVVHCRLQVLPVSVISYERGSVLNITTVLQFPQLYSLTFSPCPGAFPFLFYSSCFHRKSKKCTLVDTNMTPQRTFSSLFLL